MPWTVKDARKKNKSLAGDTEARMWVRVANKTLKALVEKGVPQEQAETRAVRAANASVRQMHQKGGGKTEGSDPDAADGRQIIREFVDCRGQTLGLDPAASVITGVKLLGLVSQNGRVYPKETIARAVGLYENAKVNVNHPQGKRDGPRDYRDRIGVIRRARLGEGDAGLFGDLHFNPEHPIAKQLAWDAEHAPENVGLSHNVAARVGHANGKQVVEEIYKVQSVDLVADPATSRGLFEDLAGSESLGDPEEIDMEALTIEQLQAERPDIAAEIAKTALQEQQNSEEAKAKDAELKELTAKVDAFQVAGKLAEQKAAVEKELKEAKLPKVLVSDLFREALWEADAEKRKALIAERQDLAKQIKGTGARSTEQRLADGEAEVDTAAFMEAVTEER